MNDTDTTSTRSTTPATPWAADGDVEVAVDDLVAVVTLVRPPGNAWTPDLGRRFFGALDGLARDPEVRAIVVTGSGPDFCVGADGGALDTIADDGGYEVSDNRPTYWMATTIGKPVVAAVNGVCFGVGMQLALLCDVRFAAASTKFATAFVRRGLIAELGMSWVLPRLVGLGVANDLLLSGRLVRAPEAFELGLVNRLVDDEQLLTETVAYARTLATTSSPAAMAVVKRQIYTDLTADLPTAADRGDRYMEAALATDDFAEGVRSWREQRPPDFPPLDPELARFPLPGEEATT